MNEFKGYGLIITSMLIWGSVGIFARLTGEPSTVIVFYRVVTAFIIMGGLWLVRGREGVLQIKANWRWALASGLALGLNWFFFFTAVQKTTVANAVLSYYTAPVIVTILSPILLRERIEKRTISSLIIGFAGILTMVIGPGSQLTPEDLLGIGAGLTAASLYAFLTVSGKRITLPATLTVLIQTGVSTLIFLPYAVNHPLPTARGMFLLVLIGAVHTALALTMYFAGIKWVKVQHVGILGYLDPLSAIIFALIFLGEIPGVMSILGGALILLSSYLILRKPKSERIGE